jgi:hypothetical protein
MPKRKHHYLLTLDLMNGEHLHCYLICTDKRLEFAAIDKLCDAAEEHGVMPQLQIVLSTHLDSGADVVEKFICEDENVRRNLAEKPNFHCTIFVAQATVDRVLMDLH